MKKLFLLLGLLVLPSLAQAQSSAQVVTTCGTLPIAYTAGSTRVLTQSITGKLCSDVTVSATVEFPTIGAAVPATGIYNGLNVAGTLRGWNGIATGALYSGAVAIVDASGAQVTSFGGSNASVSATAAAVPASATYVGINTGGNLVGWTGAVTVASGGIASGALASGSVATGAIVDDGAPGATACASDTASCNRNQQLQRIAQNLTTLNTTAGNPVPNPNSAAAWGLGSTGSAVPATANYIAGMSSTLLTGIIQADISTRINISTATTTEIVGAVTSQKVYITAWDVVAAGTGNITLVYGTGTNCATSQGTLTGTYNLTAQVGLTKGSGLGPILIAPAGNAVCVVTTAAVGMAGSMALTRGP